MANERIISRFILTLIDSILEIGLVKDVKIPTEVYIDTRRRNLRSKGDISLRKNRDEYNSFPVLSNKYVSWFG